MPSNFKTLEAFHPQKGYEFFPFRFTRLASREREVLLTNEVGEYLFLNEEEFQYFLSGALKSDTLLYEDLAAKSFLYDDDVDTSLRLLAAKYRTKKSFINEGPSLHIFVVTLRCDHSCQYCQVSRQSADLERFDMSYETALAAIDRLFDSPSPNLTVEFQGGEPLLAFPVIRLITEEITKRNQSQERQITFTVTTTLHHATDEILEFFKVHNFQISTSIDGPAWLHNLNRPSPTKDAYEKTIQALAKARQIVGIENISALTTLTKSSLTCPEEIVDTYIALGFRSIFLRPLSPYGFAVRSEGKIGYDSTDFLRFYEKALEYILEKNRQGIALEEAYTSILLTHILTPFSSSYVDLRSPTGSGLGVLVYNYDGNIYASDESRMLAEMGEDAFKLGNVHDAYQALMSSDAMQLLLATGVAESLPGCSDCAFLPYCGADPVFSLAKNNDPIGHRAFSQHCKKHMGQFKILFRYLSEADPDILRIFTAWVTRNHPKALLHGIEVGV